MGRAFAVLRQIPADLQAGLPSLPPLCASFVNQEEEEAKAEESKTSLKSLYRETDTSLIPTLGLHLMSMIPFLNVSTVR